jgi:glycosyltransferase involved in cell wall biosynthesis
MLETLIINSISSNEPSTAVLVSIVVPVYNTGAYLKECLDSVIFCDPHIFEIIIVHDGGTDNSRDIAAEWISLNSDRVNARLFDQPNSGLSAARMTGLANAVGKFVYFLDSDDIADIDVIHSAVSHAEMHDCDVVLFRSLVLDNQTLRTEPFYDSWLWDRLVEGRKFRRTSLMDEPRLLRLEPNANTRVIRRDFFERAGIKFPKGLHFEDYPPHVQEMIEASAIGLLNEIGYFYRVNRPGKITDQRDRKRFDAIKSASRALDFARSANLDTDAFANLTLQITRLLSWCAECTRDEDRFEFCRDVMVLARSIPTECYQRAKSHFVVEPRESLVLDIFEAADEVALSQLASGLPHQAAIASPQSILAKFFRKLKPATRRNSIKLL